MAEEKQVVEIPAPHAGLPDSVQKKWKLAYAQGFKDAQDDFPEDAVQQKQAALRAANKTLRVEDPTNYGEAMKLEDWHFVRRSPSEDGKTLHVVTRHGKLFSFPIPDKEQKQPTPA
jgi:hypothetical protein